jgi:glycosyltransferase involved in cell wall biosynthesis
VTIEGDGVPWPPISGRVKSFFVRATRAALLRAVRAKPREDGARRLTIFLWTAWNMGGTIRAAFNLAEYMQERGWQVDIISGIRDRDTPFFGEFPAGVTVFNLDDRREGGALRRFLRSRSSVFMPGADRAVNSFSLWSDIQLVRRLRGRRGIIVGTRPGVNLMIAQLQVPGLRAVGLEQMNLGKHTRNARRGMKRFYPQLDALVVLTEEDRDAYRQLLDGGVPLHRIPNTVRPLPGPKADLGARTVYAAGRFRYQKGFELLIPAWAETARRTQTGGCGCAGAAISGAASAG